MKKRLIALLLMCCLLVTVLSGCSKKDDQSASSPTEVPAAQQATAAPAATNSEPVELTMLCVGATDTEDYLDGDHPLFEYMCEQANVKFTSVNNISTNQGKATLMLASGKYPDVFWRLSLTELQIDKYGMEGYFIPLEDLIRVYMPNLTAILDEYDYWDDLRSGDGHIYSLPSFEQPKPDAKWGWINEQWCKNLGLEVPTTLDELYTVLKAFKEQDPNGNGEADEIPWLCNDHCVPQWIITYMANYETDTMSIWDLDTNEVYFAPTSDIWREMLEFCARCYEDGLLYKHYATNKVQQTQALASSGDIMGFLMDNQAWNFVGYERGGDYTALIIEDVPMNWDNGINMGAFMVTDKCKDPGAALRWVDQFYSYEGALMLRRGFRDVDWTENEDGTWQFVAESQEEIRKNVWIYGQNPTAGHHPAMWELKGEQIWAKNDYEYHMWYTEKTRAELLEYYENVPKRPKIYFTTAETKEWSTLYTTLDNYARQYAAQVITGEVKLDETWDSYVASMNNMGAQRFEAIMKDAYARAWSESE